MPKRHLDALGEIGHSRCMAVLAAREEVSDVKPIASVSVLVKQAGSAVAEALHQGLCDTGVKVIAVPTAYDVVVEAERAAGAVEYVLVGVDHFGPGEFRLIPLVRREWPETFLVAYHSPGFEHKGRIAELVGADTVVSTADDVSRFLAPLASRNGAQPAVPAPAPPAPPHAAPPAAPLRRLPSPAAAPTSPPPAPAAKPEPTEPASDTAPPGPAGGPQATSAAAPPTPPLVESYLASVRKAEKAPEPQHEPHPETQQPADDVENLDGDEELTGAKILGTIELTDDELRTLLGEENET